MATFRLLPSLLLSLATLFWAGNFAFGKVLVATLPPITLSLVRWSLSFLVLLPFAWRDVRDALPLLRQHAKPLLTMAITGVAGFNALTYVALRSTTAINAALMNTAAPIVVLTLSRVLLGERVKPVQLVGIVLSCAGVLWILVGGDLHRLRTLTFHPGDVLMLVAITAWGLYSVLMKKHGHLLPQRASFLVTIAMACALLFPLAATERAEWDAFLTLSPMALALLIYVGTFPSVIAFLLWNRAVMIIGPSRASVYLNLIVLFAAILGALVLGERVTLAHVVGGILVMGGVYLATAPTPFRWSRRPTQFETPEVRSSFVAGDGKTVTRPAKRNPNK